MEDPSQTSPESRQRDRQCSITKIFLILAQSDTNLLRFAGMQSFFRHIKLQDDWEWEYRTICAYFEASVSEGITLGSFT